jgi:hypothetical protein
MSNSSLICETTPLEPILNSSLAGPYLKGTVILGFAAQRVYESSKLLYPDIVVAGVTGDGETFLEHEWRERLVTKGRLRY